MSMNPTKDDASATEREALERRARMPARGAPGGARRLPGESGLKLGRVLGIEVRVDASLLIIFALIATNLGAGLFPAWHPTWSPALTWATALAAAVLFFASVLAHELSHAVMARARGIAVPRITLFLFGGVSQIEKEPDTPGSELLIAIVGPLTSFAIGLGSAFLTRWLAGPGVDLEQLEGSDARAVISALGPGATLLMWLGPINIMLALFNMVPGFPLDGGRVLRALLWWGTRDITKATRWASLAGQAVGWLLIASGTVILFGGDVLQGMWLVLIGWFLNNAARSSRQQQLIEHALAGVAVTRVMRTSVMRVDPDLPVEQLVRELLWDNAEQHAFPVERDGELLGMVTLSDARKVPQERWPVTPVSAVMTPRDRLTTLPAEAGAERAAEELARHNVDQIPIVRGEELIGVVRRADIVRWVGLQG